MDDEPGYLNADYATLLDDDYDDNDDDDDNKGDEDRCEDGTVYKHQDECEIAHKTESVTDADKQA